MIVQLVGPAKFKGQHIIPLHIGGICGTQNVDGIFLKSLVKCHQFKTHYCVTNANNSSSMRFSNNMFNLKPVNKTIQRQTIVPNAVVLIVVLL